MARRTKKKAKRPRVVAAEKTAIKTAKPSGRNGNRLPLGAHPGNTGGKPGRSGRPKAEYKTFWREVLTNKDTREAIKRALANEKSPSFGPTLKIGSDRAYGPVEKKVRVAGEVTLVLAEKMKQARERANG